MLTAADIIARASSAAPTTNSPAPQVVYVSSPRKFPWFTLLIILVVILGGGYLYTVGIAVSPVTTVAQRTTSANVSLPLASAMPLPTAAIAAQAAQLIKVVPKEEYHAQPTPYCGTDGNLYQDGKPAPRVIGYGCGVVAGGPIDNAIIDYGPDRAADGTYVQPADAPADAPVPTFAPTQAAAYRSQFGSAPASNSAFVGCLPGHACNQTQPTPWPTTTGAQPGDPDFAASFK